MYGSQQLFNLFSKRTKIKSFKLQTIIIDFKWCKIMESINKNHIMCFLNKQTFEYRIYATQIDISTIDKK